VIGHPQGSPEIQLSLHDSVVLDVDEVHAHYRSPTEKGSSGSPVFDDRWRVIALHHGWTDNVPGIADAGGGANEGIRLDRLLAALAT
jgi:V8-like Glu-specific endopeptidase